MGKPENGKATPMHLSGWQAIADYFHRNPSTVRRWAAEHGLPVHRAAGAGAKKGAAVFAYPEELDAWLRRFNSDAGRDRPQAPEPAPETVAPAPEGGDNLAARRAAPPRRARRLWPVAAGLAAGVVSVSLLVFAGFSVWPGGAPQPYLPTEPVRQLYSNGVYLLEKRTPAGLPLAVEKLEMAIRQDPRYDRAWSALATAYNLMVEYRLIDPGEGYGRAKAAAEKAIGLNPLLASAHTVLADLEFSWSREIDKSLRRFERAVALDPGDAQTRHWYASALALSGEPNKALAEIEKAKYADPESRSIRVSEAIILLAAGHAAQAGKCLEELIVHEPQFRNPYRFLAFVRLAGRDYRAYLEALEKRFELTDDEAGARIVLAGRRGFAAAGPDGMAAAMIAAMRDDGLEDKVEPYFRAHFHALSGDAARTAESLKSVPTRHAFYYSIDPAFTALRKQGEFQDALREMHLPVI